MTFFWEEHMYRYNINVYSLWMMIFYIIIIIYVNENSLILYYLSCLFKL